MSQESCEMSLQQTQELLRLIDRTLQDISRRRFIGSDLYVDALQKVLGGYGRRGPLAILLMFLEPDGSVSTGRLFHLREGAGIEKSEEMTIDPSYGASLARTATQTEVFVTNLAEGESAAAYRTFFPPGIVTFIGAPVRNFVVHGFGGIRPGVISAFNYPGKATEYDGTILHGLSVVISSVVTLSHQVRETEEAFIYTVEALARACETAEEHTGRHIVRVNRYAGALAANMGLSSEFVTTISYSAQMHDVGKIRIPAAILLKPGPLSVDEMELMKLHPVYGEIILGDSPRLEVAREIAISHHENWDGSGYPYRRQGENIPLSGRIVKVADVYDALRSRRSYKLPLSHGEALEVFRNGDGRIDPVAHFDPGILAVFFRIEHIFSTIYESNAGTADD